MGYCPSEDHDGYREPATRLVNAHRGAGASLEFTDDAYCAYCAEGVVSRLVSEGWTVLIRLAPVAPKVGVRRIETLSASSDTPE